MKLTKHWLDIENDDKVRTQVVLTQKLKQAIQSKQKLTGETLSSYLRKAALLRLTIEAKKQKELDKLAEKLIGSVSLKNHPEWQTKKKFKNGKKSSRELEMKLYLVDTNVLIYGLAGKKTLADLLKNWIKKKQLALSSIVVTEFLIGATEDEAKNFEALLDRFDSLPVDTAVARLAANYRKKFLKKGYKLKLPDCLIAATCKLCKAVFVTFNKSDYPMKDISIFKI